MWIVLLHRYDAVKAGDYANVAKNLKLGANPNAPAGKKGITAMHRVAALGGRPGLRSSLPLIFIVKCALLHNPAVLLHSFTTIHIIWLVCLNAIGNRKIELLLEDHGGKPVNKTEAALVPPDDVTEISQDDEHTY